MLKYYHRVLVVKYRRKAIDDEISARLRDIFEYMAPNYGLAVEERNHDRDHVHVLFTGQPKSALSKFIDAYKSAGSRLIKKEFPAIREKLWKEYFWSQRISNTGSIQGRIRVAPRSGQSRSLQCSSEFETGV